MNTEEMERRLLRLESILGRPRRGYEFIPLANRLTSTSWDGDSYSTTAKTLIDLSAVFGVPAGVKAVLIHASVRDSASAADSTLYLVFSPSNTAGTGAMWLRPGGLPNDYVYVDNGIVPCDANGDIYYQIVASGANTMDVWIEIWGYWVTGKLEP